MEECSARTSGRTRCTLIHEELFSYYGSFYQRRYVGLLCDERLKLQICIREEDQVHQVLVGGQSVNLV
jgi:hypothetical protein